MRNLIYLNADGMVNVHPEKNTVQINDEYYCEMNETEFSEYIDENNLEVINGRLTDIEDGFIYGVVLEKA
jgi:hypothetical protein